MIKNDYLLELGSSNAPKRCGTINNANEIFNIYLWLNLFGFSHSHADTNCQLGNNK